MMINDMGRRIFLARLLKIPVALLGLDWHQVVDDPHAASPDPLAPLAELIEEDAYYLYEDILVMGHEYIHNGGPLSIAYRVDRRLRKLEALVRNAHSSEKEAWKTLLCRFYQLSTRIKQQVLFDKPAALKHAQLAIQLATELQDPVLLASSHVHAACTYHQQINLDAAQTQIAWARQYLEKVPNAPLKGNIYLESANIGASLALYPQQQVQCQKWQERATNMLYKGDIEDDECYFHFNLAAVNHEKARVLLSFAARDGKKIGSDVARDIRSKLKAAALALPPDLTVWRIYFQVTEAHLYRAERDIEGCVHTAKTALALARALHAKTEEAKLKSLYTKLIESGMKSPYVDNLGVELGIFPQ